MERLDENEKLIQQRSFLLPWWIKFFGVLYIFMGVISLPVALFTDNNLFMFGISAQGGILSIELIIVVSINVFFGVSAFGLLRGKSWGLYTCIANGYIGIAICVIVSVLSIINGVLSIQLEPIIQVLFLLKLYKIKRDWFTVNEKLNKSLNG